VPHLESPGVHCIDLVWNGHPGQVAAYLVDGGDALAVVETGPTSTLPAVLDAIREIGRAPACTCTRAVRPTWPTRRA
jgi:hypothetical protein